MSEKHQKVKVITFNTNNHYEKFLYDYANGMKDDKQSFSGLMKHLLVSYITSTGTPLPGSLDMEQVQVESPKNKKESTKKEKNTKKPKMGGGAFFYDED